MFAGSDPGRRRPGTYRDERGVDVSARLLRVTVVVRGLVRVVLALLAQVQLVFELHPVKVICAKQMRRKSSFKTSNPCSTATWKSESNLRATDRVT